MSSKKLDGNLSKMIFVHINRACQSLAELKTERDESFNRLFESLILAIIDLFNHYEALANTATVLFETAMQDCYSAISVCISFNYINAQLAQDSLQTILNFLRAIEIDFNKFRICGIDTIKEWSTMIAKLHKYKGQTLITSETAKGSIRAIAAHLQKVSEKKLQDSVSQFKSLGEKIETLKKETQYNKALVAYKESLETLKSINDLSCLGGKADDILSSIQAGIKYCINQIVQLKQPVEYSTFSSLIYAILPSALNNPSPAMETAFRQWIPCILCHCLMNPSLPAIDNSTIKRVLQYFDAMDIPQAMLLKHHYSISDLRKILSNLISSSREYSKETKSIVTRYEALNNNLFLFYSFSSPIIHDILKVIVEKYFQLMLQDSNKKDK